MRSNTNLEDEFVCTCSSNKGNLLFLVCNSSLLRTHSFFSGPARDLLQPCQLDPKGASCLGHVVAEIRGIHIDAKAYQTTQGRINWLHQNGHDTHHRQRDMALFRLASACAFKDLCHLIQCQVLWPTNLDHLIVRARVLQCGADKTSNVLHRHKIDRIVATSKDGGLALLQNGLTDQLGPEVHERNGPEDSEAQTTGAQILLRAVLDAEELQWSIWAVTQNGHKQEVLHACGFGRIDQLMIAR